MAEAAVLGTQIEHSSALGGLLAGLVVGAIVVGALAATVATGGVAGALFIGAAACGGASMGGMIGERFGSFATSKEGPITSNCVATVLYEGKPAAHATSLITCNKDGPGAIAQGSATVFVGGFMASRKGDKTTCGAKIGSGCKTVDIGGPTATQSGMTIDEEVPEWMHTALTVLGVVGAVGTIIFAPAAVGISMLGMAARVGCGFALGTGGHYLGEWGGGKLFGEGSLGQAVTTTIGELAGGILGGKIGGDLVPGKIGAPGITDLTKGIEDFRPYFLEGTPAETTNILRGQMTADHCVPTSLDMVLRDMGQELPSPYIEGALNFNEGAYIKDIPTALKDLGIENDAVYSETAKISEIENALGNGDKVIATVGDSNGKNLHAVVVDGVENGNVIIRDPLPVGAGSVYSIPQNVFSSALKSSVIIYK